jgi:glycosyltransferase involved in cell wall biosynthesis
MKHNPKIALIHDWLVEKGGAENVLAALLELWPGAPIYTLVHDPQGPCQPLVAGHQVYTSYLQNLPFAIKNYRSYLPLMPLAIEQFDLSSYDIILSNSYAVAKGVLTGPDTLHISYCCSPIRYAWDLQHQYLRESGKEKGIQSWLIRWILHQIRKWDYRTPNGVDEFIAISHYIARRIWKVYRRESLVVYPPVDVNYFELHEQKEDFFVTASRMVPYKQIQLIVKTFSELPEEKLVVIGDGPQFKKIKALAASNIELLGFQSTDVLRAYLQRAKALVFASEEDFGIVPVEAQACGTPVIAYRKGGALETVIPGKTGIFFAEQTVLSLKQAIKKFNNIETCWNPQAIRKNAQRFNKEQFQQKIQNFIEETWQEYQKKSIYGLSVTNTSDG